MKASDIFKWRQVSTALSGNTEIVRSDYKGDKYNEAYIEEFKNMTIENTLNLF